MIAGGVFEPRPRLTSNQSFTVIVPIFTVAVLSSAFIWTSIVVAREIVKRATLSWPAPPFAVPPALPPLILLKQRF